MSKKIIVMGNKDMAVACLDFLLKKKENVLGVVCNNDDDPKQKTWSKSLKGFCLKRKVKYWQPKNCSDPYFVETVKKLQPDLIFSFSYNRIIKADFIKTPKIGIFNIHFAALPKHRGCLPIVYALALGETHVGVTLHYIDPGIDSGEIVDQRLVKVTKKDTAYTMYFKCVKMGTSLFIKNLPLIKKGGNKKKPQNLTEGSYHTQEYPFDRWIDWTKKASDTDSLIRALTFEQYPSARTKFKNREFEILNPVNIRSSRGKFTAGQIKETGPKLTVTTGKNLLVANRFRLKNKLTDTAELVKQLKLKKGDILG